MTNRSIELEAALRLALEALQSDDYGTHVEAVNEIHKALDTSLAQPAVSETHKQSTTCGEPVVWMYQDKNTHEVKFQKHMRDFVDHGATYEVPLYTTPPTQCKHCLQRSKEEL